MGKEVESNKLDADWVEFRDWIEKIGGGVWKTIGPGVIALGAAAIPAVLNPAAGLLASGGSLVAVGTLIGQGIVAVAKTQGVQLLGQDVLTLANEATAQVLAHSAVTSSTAASQTLATAPTAAQAHATIVAAAASVATAN